MTAPIVNSSSIPLTGNAVVTQGSEPGLDAFRPGFFLLDTRSQGPPVAPAAPADNDPSGSTLPPDGNVLPFLFLSLLQVQPEPTVQPPATGAEPVPATSAPVESVQAQPATLVDRLVARRDTVFDPLFATAHKVIDPLRPTPTRRPY